MAMKYKQEGGGAASPLAGDFLGFLQNGLNTGNFQTAAGGGMTGIGGILNDLLSGGAGKIGGSMQDMISRTQKQNVDALRARFSVGGGTGFGTPAAYAESNYRATEAPELVQAIGGLQENALSMLLPMFGQAVQLGTPQAQMVGQQNPWMQAAGIALPAAGTALGMMAGGPGGAMVGSKIGSSMASGFQPSDINFSSEFNPSMPNPFTAGNGWQPAWGM